MGFPSSDSGRALRLAAALAVSLCVTAFACGIGCLISGLFPSTPRTFEDYMGLAILFLGAFAFQYFIVVRKSAKVLEFERLARLGGELSRRAGR